MHVVWNRRRKYEKRNNKIEKVWLNSSASIKVSELDYIFRAVVVRWFHYYSRLGSIVSHCLLCKKKGRTWMSSKTNERKKESKNWVNKQMPTWKAHKCRVMSDTKKLWRRHNHIERLTRTEKTKNTQIASRYWSQSENVTEWSAHFSKFEAQFDLCKRTIVMNELLKSFIYLLWRANVIVCVANYYFVVIDTHGSVQNKRNVTVSSKSFFILFQLMHFL